MCLQEMILEKVREDVMVRMKISQSSALRQKRGSQKPDAVETESLLGLNNNKPVPRKENNGLVHDNSNSGESQNIFDQMEVEEMEEEEENLSTESPSDVSKFESVLTLFESSS